jgi:hypothetical protein
MLLPSIKFEITSNKTPEQIESLLKEETNGGIFQGKASVTEFKLMKKTEYVRNSFSPVIISHNVENKPLIELINGISPKAPPSLVLFNACNIPPSVTPTGVMRPLLYFTNF